MIFSSLCPFLGIRPPSAFVQRTTSGGRTQLSPCLIFGFWVKIVTHILGVRAFGTQLLCEQVVGRGLRRRSVAVQYQSSRHRILCDSEATAVRA